MYSFSTIVIVLDIHEPWVLQCLQCRNPLFRIEVCHSPNEVLKLVVDIFNLPLRERFSGVVLVETGPHCLKDVYLGGSRVPLLEILQKVVERFLVSKIRYLASKGNREAVVLFRNLFSQDPEDDSSGHGVNALQKAPNLLTPSSKLRATTTVLVNLPQWQTRR